MLVVIFFLSVIIFIWSRPKLPGYNYILPSDVVFVRDYIGLTLVGLFYYSTKENFSKHYIFGSLPFMSLFLAAAMAFTFMSIALIVRKYLFAWLSARNSIRHPLAKNIYITANKKFLVRCLTIVTFVSSLWIVYVNKSTIIAVFSSSISGIQVSEARYFVSSNTAYKYLFKALAPALFFLNLVFVYNSRGHSPSPLRLNNFFALISFISAFIGTIFFFEKSSIVSIVFLILGALIYNGVKVRISLGLLCSLVLLPAALIACAYLITYSIPSISYLYDIIIHRFTSQVSGLIVSAHHFSINEPLGWASISSTFSDPSSRVLSPYFYLMSIYSDSDFGRALSSFAAGDSYAAFGIMGILAGGIILGINLAFLDWFPTVRWSPLKFFYIPVYITIFSYPVIASSFYSFFFPVGFVLSSMPFIIICFLDDVFEFPLPRRF
jgi:hypothetical protein